MQPASSWNVRVMWFGSAGQEKRTTSGCSLPLCFSWKAAGAEEIEAFRIPDSSQKPCAENIPINLSISLSALGDSCWNLNKSVWKRAFSRSWDRFRQCPHHQGFPAGKFPVASTTFRLQEDSSRLDGNVIVVRATYSFHLKLTAASMVRYWWNSLALLIWIVSIGLFACICWDSWAVRKL